MYSSKLALVVALMKATATSAQTSLGNKFRTSHNLHECYDNSLWTGDQDAAVNQPNTRKLDRGDTLQLDIDDDGSGTIPRGQVVQALQDAFASESNFIVEFTDGDHTHVVDITHNEMDVKPPHPDLGDYSAAFQVTSKFVVEDDTKFRVKCPAAASGNDCSVTVVPQNGVNCFGKNAVLTHDIIPSKCLDQVYKMSLRTQGSHFFLVVAKDDASADGCPPNLAFASKEGEKFKSVMFIEHAESLPKIELGAATLGDILKAEEAAEPLDDSTYDFVTNSCINYASRITRPLDIKETDELASFLIENIVGSDELFENMSSSGLEYGNGGVRALAARAMGKDYLKVYIEGAVYSQLELD